ncbi:uncharacterized protein LOC141690882 [Apium graveolens]|uniref:uncharacterized protein LOC141690882 n=1 Tax=Apium graveolens TaxID=4045 RepID=UPI003D7AF41D
MIKYLEETRVKLLEFHIACLDEIMREENQRADILAKLATDEDHSPSVGLYKILLTSPSVTPLTKPASEILVISYDPNWMTPIYLYLQEGILPQNKRAAQLLHSKAAHYTIIDDTLYRRSFLASLLKCVDYVEADYCMLEVHEGICGIHSSGEALAHKIIRQGYNRPTLRRDCLNYFKTCAKCQFHASIPHCLRFFLRLFYPPSL